MINARKKSNTKFKENWIFFNSTLVVTSLGGANFLYEPRIQRSILIKEEKRKKKGQQQKTWIKENTLCHNKHILINLRA